MVKRMIDPDESGKGALRLEFGCHRLERNARARKCDRPWSVESGNRDRSIVTRNESQSFIFGQPDGEHRSFAASARFHQTRAQRDNPGRFFDGKNAGDAGRGDLTHAMTNNGGRLNAPGFPKRRERHLHRKDGGLPNLRPVHLGRFFGAAEFFEEREARPGTERSVTLFNRLAKDRLMLHQIATHSPPLRALPAHDETDARRLLAAGSESRADLRALLFLRERVEFLGAGRPNSKRRELTDAGDDFAGRPTYK